MSITNPAEACAVAAPTSAPTTPPAQGRNWSLAANAGALLSAFLASACCIGPLVFALLGLGGGALLVKFEPYRPYFMAVTLSLLGAGFYFTYRKPKVVLGDDCGCPAPRTNRIGRIMLWVTTAMVLAFLAFPTVMALLSD